MFAFSGRIGRGAFIRSSTWRLVFFAVACAVYAFAYQALNMTCSSGNECMLAGYFRLLTHAPYVGLVSLLLGLSFVGISLRRARDLDLAGVTGLYIPLLLASSYHMTVESRALLLPELDPHGSLIYLSFSPFITALPAIAVLACLPRPAVTSRLNTVLAYVALAVSLVLQVFVVLYNIAFLPPAADTINKIYAAIEPLSLVLSALPYILLVCLLVRTWAGRAQERADSDTPA